MPSAVKKSSKNFSKKARQKADAGNVIRPGEDIVASMAEDLKSKLLRMVKTEIKELIIDLSGVEVVDSVGFGVVIAAHNSLNAAGGSLKVVNVSEDIYRLFQAIRLDQHFEVQCAP